MNLIEKQPWFKDLKVSEKDFKKWESEGSENSFIFWSLHNNIINKKQYFDWAIEYYQIPLLQDMFFEQHLMTRWEWKEVRNLFDWTAEKMPVAVWEDTVFIACLEPPIQEEKFDFKHRFVLASSTALRTTWNFTKELSKLVNKEEENTQSKSVTQTNSVTNAPSHSITTTQTGFLEDTDKESQKKAFTPEVPSETKHPLAKPLIHQPSIQSKVKENTQSAHLKKPKLNELKVNKPSLKSEISLPEPEEDRFEELENKTFPGRSHEEDNNLIMGDFKGKTSKVSSKLSSQAKKDTQELTVTKGTATLYLINQNQNYEKLFLKTKSLFCTSMVLQVKENKVSSLVWSGRIKMNRKDEELADLKDYSLFKVVQRGHPLSWLCCGNRS